MSSSTVDYLPKDLPSNGVGGVCWRIFCVVLSVKLAVVRVETTFLRCGSDGSCDSTKSHPEVLWFKVTSNKKG